MTAPDPAAWSDRYQRERTPWDLGGPHPELVSRLALDPTLGSGSLGTVYVPGCGRGHDAVALAAAGWHVIASDFAPALQSTVSEALARHGGEFRLGDSLLFDGSADLWFDHTFFCAISPTKRDAYGRASANVVRRAGRVASIVFPVRRALVEHGPPFSMSTDDLTKALGASFALIADQEASKPPRRRWPNRWAVWERL